MNRKELKERIRQSALEEMPDIFSKININQVSIEPNIKETKPMRMRYKFVLSGFVLVLMAFFTFQLFFQQPSSQPFESDVELLAFQAVSAQSFIEYGETDLDQLSYLPHTEDLLINVSEATDVNDYLDDMSKMIELGELLINEKSQIQYQELQSDDEDYDYQIRFSSMNLLGETITYDIYFNEENDEVNGKLVQADDAYVFNQSAESLKLYIENDVYIEVQYQENESIHQFNFRYMKQATELFSTRIDMVLENNAYQADFEYNNQMGKIISLQMTRKDDDTMDVDYNIRDNAKRFYGKFNLSVENNQVTGKPIYRFTFDDESETQTTKPGYHQPHNPQGGPRN